MYKYGSYVVCVDLLNNAAMRIIFNLSFVGAVFCSIFIHNRCEAFSVPGIGRTCNAAHKAHIYRGRECGHQTFTLQRRRSNHDQRRTISLKSSSNNDVDFQSLSKDFCRFSPLWTVLSALIGIKKSAVIAPTLGSLYIMQNALAILMLAMGLTITPKDFGEAVRKPYIIALNAILCYGMMPLLAVSIASFFQYNSSLTAGMVLLGSVSGGQASNLFALLAGGDVALSVVCTISTTLMGVLATPVLIKTLLNSVVAVDGISVLQSVASLVLMPLLCGLGFGSVFPKLVKLINPFCPIVGVLSTLILVAGSAANSTFSLGIDKVSIVGACLLPIIGGCVALILSYMKLPTSMRMKEGFGNMTESSRRTLVVETLSKSPTLAYILARKHFGESAATIPAAGMISLAVVGAVVASLWSILDPIEK